MTKHKTYERKQKKILLMKYYKIYSNWLKLVFWFFFRFLLAPFIYGLVGSRCHFFSTIVPRFEQREKIFPFFMFALEFHNHVSCFMLWFLFFPLLKALSYPFFSLFTLTNEWYGNWFSFRCILIEIEPLMNVSRVCNN